MDPSSIQALAEASDRYQLKVDGVGGLTELHNSDGESLTEIGNSDNEVNAEDSPGTIVDSDSEKSVHIIFLRGDSDSVSNVDSVNIDVKVEGTSLSCDVGNKSVQRFSPSQLPSSTGSCGNSSCQIENIEISGEESGVCLEKIPVGEVEDDFDVSEGMVYQVEQRPPRGPNPRKKKKKKFFKVCKACGVLVERQDLISHIKDHKRRKLELASNPNHDKNVPALENVNSPKNSNLTETDMSLADCGIGNADIIPESSLSNLLTDRPFKCSVCSETFRTQSSLTIHFKSHSGDCSNSCPVS